MKFIPPCLSCILVCLLGVSCQEVEDKKSKSNFISGQQLFDLSRPLLAASQHVFQAGGPRAAYEECFKEWQDEHQAGEKLYGNIGLSLRVLRGRVSVSVVSTPEVDSTKDDGTTVSGIEPSVASCVAGAFDGVAFDVEGVNDASYFVAYPFCMKNIVECPDISSFPLGTENAYFQSLPATNESLHPLFLGALNSAKASESAADGKRVIASECRCSLCRVAHGADSLEPLNQWSVEFQKEFLKQAKDNKVGFDRFRMTNERPVDLQASFASVMYVDYSEHAVTKSSQAHE